MTGQTLSARNLSLARNKVIANKGACGVDGMEVSDLRAFIGLHRSAICTSIIHRRYRIAPVRGVDIPKGKGRTRSLGVPTVVERWLQQAVGQQPADRFELDLEEGSYGLRPRKNARQAVLKGRSYINDGHQDMVDIDLKRSFDEVPHYKLLQLIYHKVSCKTTSWPIRKWLRAPILIRGELHKRRKGIPQGSPSSPLLSNILLDQLDKCLKEKGYKFVRYADDFSVYTTSKSKARAIGNETHIFLRDKLDLPIDREKSGIRRPNPFKILGHGSVPTYKKGAEGQYQIVVDKRSWQTLERKLKHIAKRTLPMRLTERIAELKPIYRGWPNNFRLGNIEGRIKRLDEWSCDRLRYCIWADWKKPGRKRKDLIGLGVGQGQAYAWSRTRMGGWAVAQSPILKTTMTKARLEQRGYEQMLDHYHKVRSR